ncbi:MAG: PH domain-containing protein, partial [Chloroflexi bacterium]|nr:PH domain-containing protein [Chloroflexota bacterium]
MPTYEEINTQIKNMDISLGINFLFRKGSIKELAKVMWQGENLLNIIDAKLDKDNEFGILAATDQRLLFVCKPPISFQVKVEQFNYDKINSLQYKTGIAFGEVTIFVSGNTHTLSDIPKERVRDFAEQVQQLISKVHQRQAPTYLPSQQPPNQPQPAPDMISQLERLAKLKEEGLLAEEEFLAQKQKLLGFPEYPTVPSRVPDRPVPST